MVASDTSELRSRALEVWKKIRPDLLAVSQKERPSSAPIEVSSSSESGDELARLEAPAPRPHVQEKSLKRVKRKKRKAKSPSVEAEPARKVLLLSARKDLTVKKPQLKGRPIAGVYLPPGRKLEAVKQAEWQRVKAAWHAKLAEEDLGGMPKKAQEPNIRTLARKSEGILEKHGSCGFNVLQADVGVNVAQDGCSAWFDGKALGAAAAGAGLKALPLLGAGRYHYEVELLRCSALVVGWSAATSLPAAFDQNSFGYRSDGRLVNNFDSDDGEIYGPAFGHTGDVVGVLLDWRGSGPKISFSLNGERLGVAFDLSAEGLNCPLQPHLCQVRGQGFQLRLRGTEKWPLRFPAPGFKPIADSSEAHFRPFSEAVAAATAQKPPTIARRLIHSSLGIQLPLSHLAQERQQAPRRILSAKVSGNSPPKFGGA
mmetsp:Transcript_82806/g.146307  ORF Transcript_82806/g.146307 Transcript_82806/m.146307 type:complete len:427 (+) Transcript_82806:55-1335(+)|eukprot:CAMPEP_0197625790 /NCGR_PEP_ID=MMETSP1338-20131121/5049_1 /TAXON_ID=43686 ORGANISM="Pelagodinium beii, Strain RCC1491" /NCGR_SAMPLE_ID=MMETSP1338 /ASSEMBLY_ACC=CAM_ASM_000754 /LENGTH=426 /DNA_ID=CAMNT_0043196277 /DNA_START=36 /DNA_END=1316 /DNA_ORIENTATION=+